MVDDFQGQSPAVLVKPEQNYGDSEALIKAKNNQGNRTHPKKQDTVAAISETIKSTQL